MNWTYKPSHRSTAHFEAHQKNIAITALCFHFV